MEKTLRDRVIDFVNDQESVKRICYLYERWQDEKEYEDFKDYTAEFKKLFGPASLKGYQRPFGFCVQNGKEKFRVSVKIKRNQFEIGAEQLF